MWYYIKGVNVVCGGGASFKEVPSIFLKKNQLFRRAAACLTSSSFVKAVVFISVYFESTVVTQCDLVEILQQA